MISCARQRSWRTNNVNSLQGKAQVDGMTGLNAGDIPGKRILQGFGYCPSKMVLIKVPTDVFASNFVTAI